jgi:uncharacterized protein YggE
LLLLRQVFLVTLFLPAISFGQTAGRPVSVRATGEAVVSVAPDQAKVNIGVITKAQTAQNAAAQNAAQTRAVLEKLRAAMPKADIRTIGYSVSPDYQYPRDGGKPAITGYTAQNTVQMTIDNLSAIGQMIDTATAGGANQIQSLQFTLRDEKPARARALREAALTARSNAESMAGALGLKLGPVIWVDEGASENIRPPMPLMAARVAAGPTPVEPGTIEVHATVTLTIGLQ